MNGMHLPVTNVSVPARYSLSRSLSSLGSGRQDPTLSIADNHVAFSLLTPDGPAVVCAVPVLESLEVGLEGDGAEWLKPRLPKLFGLHDDPPEFERTGPLRDLGRKYRGIHLPRLPAVFHRLLKIVLHQLVTWEEAAHGWHTMTQRYGEPAPGGSGLLVGPTPTTLKSLACYDLVDCGLSSSTGPTNPDFSHCRA